MTRDDPQSIAADLANAAYTCRGDETELVELCAAAARKLRHVTGATLDGLALAVDLEGGPGQCVANLEKPVAEIAAAGSPEAAGEALERFLGSLDEIRSLGGGHAELDPNEVVPLVRPEDFGMAAGIVLADGLLLVFAEDRPATFRYLGVDALKKLGASPDEVVQLALQNLQRKMPSVELIAGENGVNYVACGGKLRGQRAVDRRLLGSGLRGVFRASDRGGAGERPPGLHRLWRSRGGGSAARLGRGGPRTIRRSPASSLGGCTGERATAGSPTRVSLAQRLAREHLGERDDGRAVESLAWPRPRAAGRCASRSSAEP